MASLRSWLRQVPQPHNVRIRTADDEDMLVELSPNARNRWKAAEQSILAARAVTVFCLDKAGSVLRSQTLEPDEDDEPATKGSGDGAALAVARAGAHKELAAVLDRYGERLNEAFDRGAGAASTGQENLIALVETLSAHLANAITNLHQVSVNLANVISGIDPGDDDGDKSKSGPLLAQVLAQVAMRSAGAAPPAPPPNGKGKHHG